MKSLILHLLKTARWINILLSLMFILTVIRNSFFLYPSYIDSKISKNDFRFETILESTVIILAGIMTATIRHQISSFGTKPNRQLSIDLAIKELL